MIVCSRAESSSSAWASQSERVRPSRARVTLSSGVGRWSARKSCHWSSPVGADRRVQRLVGARQADLHRLDVGEVDRELLRDQGAAAIIERAAAVLDAARAAGAD